MSSKSYFISYDDQGFPGIYPVNDQIPPDAEWRTWREAKKQLRQWYITQIKEVRKMTERTYFQDV